MPEPTPPGVAEGAAVHPAEALSPDAVAAVLADFGAWLSGLSGPPPEAPEGPSPPVDLHTLVGQFVALRHEVNLQTRATRGQQEQNAEALQKLGQALESLRRAQDSARQGQEQNTEEQLRPLLKTLVDLYDALSLAGRETARVQEGVLPVLDQLVAAAEPPAEPPPRPESLPPRGPFWGRWLGVRPEVLEPAVARWEAERQQERQARRERARQAQDGAGRVRQMLTSLVTGYTMGLQRVERALRQYGLEPIPAVGQPFDPERMEALEAVTDSGRPTGEVVAEVRRGYLWHGRVFRYAQVRVAKTW